jgi:hypothetical protein
VTGWPTKRFAKEGIGATLGIHLEAIARTTGDALRISPHRHGAQI